ncbi:unnamed protein product [Moneuplotes crassus]|uniref:Uncharacterized protein n=1 Tax=Euplotes crassus TaxID=5936 RepID=A0AAD2CX47_EUPCR|nr:unnamed protein product [Moneuplotes crassus]
MVPFISQNCKLSINPSRNMSPLRDSFEIDNFEELIEYDFIDANLGQSRDKKKLAKILGVEYKEPKPNGLKKYQELQKTFKKTDRTTKNPFGTRNSNHLSNFDTQKWLRARNPSFPTQRYKKKAFKDKIMKSINIKENTKELLKTNAHLAIQTEKSLENIEHFLDTFKGDGQGKVCSNIQKAIKNLIKDPKPDKYQNLHKDIYPLKKDFLSARNKKSIQTVDVDVSVSPKERKHVKLPDLNPMTIRKYLKKDLEENKVNDWESIKPKFKNYKKKSISKKKMSLQKPHYGFSPFPPNFSPRNLGETLKKILRE